MIMKKNDKKIIPWEYNGNILEITSEDKDKVGFVYLVIDKKTNKKYIGKKYIWKKIARPPLKGKKRRRIDYVQSDWKTYTTSCEPLSNAIKERPIEEFEFKILHLCSAKGLTSYLEAKEQFLQNVLLDDNFYNGIIQCRINSNHVKGLEDYEDYENYEDIE